MQYVLWILATLVRQHSVRYALCILATLVRKHSARAVDPSNTGEAALSTCRGS